MPDTDVGSSSPPAVGSFIPVQFPPSFSGDSDFVQWCRRFEVAVDACPNSRSVDLAKTLGSRLTGSAFTVWYAFPTEVRNDYKKAKAELGKIFAKRDEVTSFQRMINARPRQPGEPLEVYKSELDRLTTLAFPLLDANARKDEIFRRFVAGLSPDMQAKCHEHGAQNIDNAMDIAQRVERASESHKLHTPFIAHTPQVAVATGINSDPLDLILKKINNLQVTVETLQSQCDSLRDAQRDASRSRSLIRSDYTRPSSRSRDRYNSPSNYDRRDYSNQKRDNAYARSSSPNRERYSRGRSPSPYPSRNRDQARDAGYRSSEYPHISRSSSRRDYSPRRDHDTRRDGDRYRYRSQSPSERISTDRPSQSSSSHVSFQENGH